MSSLLCLSRKVTDMQGSWVCGTNPVSQGSHRKLPKAASVNERRESVCDRGLDWVRNTSRIRGGRNSSVEQYCV